MIFQTGQLMLTSWKTRYIHHPYGWAMNFGAFIASIWEKKMRKIRHINQRWCICTHHCFFCIINIIKKLMSFLSISMSCKILKSYTNYTDWIQFNSNLPLGPVFHIRSFSGDSPIPEKSLAVYIIFPVLNGFQRVKWPSIAIISPKSSYKH